MTPAPYVCAPPGLGVAWAAGGEPGPRRWTSPPSARGGGTRPIGSPAARSLAAPARGRQAAVYGFARHPPGTPAQASARASERLGAPDAAYFLGKNAVPRAWYAVAGVIYLRLGS